MDVSTDGFSKLCLNPLFCFAPTSLGPCKAAESHLRRVTYPQYGRDQHLLGNAPVTVLQAGQEPQAVAGLAVGSTTAAVGYSTAGLLEGSSWSVEEACKGFGESPG